MPLEHIFKVPYEVGLVINWLLGFIMVCLLYLLWRVYRKHYVSTWTTKCVARITVLLALSIMGAQIQIGGGGVALDSMPGFFAAGYFGFIEGVTVCILGCIASHIFGGLIGLIPIIWTSYPAMGLAAGLYAYTYRRFKSPLNCVLAIICAILVNTFGCLIPIAFVLGGLAFLVVWTPVLLYAATLNTVLATILIEVLKRFRRTI